MRRLLVVEDDPEIADLVLLHLRNTGYEAEHVRKGRDALDRLDADRFDLLILDLGLPGGVDGLEVCRRLRARGDLTPVVMLTARGEEIDRVVGLELGADDYVTKPFSVRELLARVNALLRRLEAIDERQEGLPPVLEFGALRIDTVRHRAEREGAAIDLTPREFDLLVWFARHPGRVFTRGELLEHVWGYGHEGYAHTVNSHINRLRSKLERDPAAPEFVLTVWGVGYKFAEHPAR
ncbi:MAG: response regulator transcription factor [Myxococcota bacterium]